MAKIVISNAIANIAELKSRLRGVKTPGKRILAAAFKNNDYSALIGELLTRIELYQSVGVLDYKLKDVDTIQNMKFKFGFEPVLASTLKASGVSSSPRVVQQIVRQQQVMAPVSFQNVVKLSENAKAYTKIFAKAVKTGDLTSEDADMWHIQPAGVKNTIAKRLDNDIDIMLDKKSEYDMNDEGEAGEFWEKMSYISGDFGDDMDNKYSIGSDVASELLFAAFNYASGPSDLDAPIPQNVPNNNSNRYLAFMSQAVKAGYISPEILNITKSLSHKERNDMFDIVADGFDAIEKTTLHYTSTGYEQDSDAIIDAIRPISADIKSDLTHYGFDLNQAKQILIGIDRSKGY